MIRDASPICFRVTADEREVIVAAARKAGFKSHSDFVRTASLKAALPNKSMLAVGVEQNVSKLLWDIKLLVSGFMSDEDKRSLALVALDQIEKELDLTV